MSETLQKQTLGFQTEVKQLLHLVTHALYSNKEIFLRELISNASDAADRLRFEALSKNELLEQDPDLKITVDVDPDNSTITISDNGIGMSREEAIEHLGTIAKSGTHEFLQALSGEQAKDSRLIGQFGVGFYSSFIVADKVTVRSRRAGLPVSEGVLWESEGTGEFTVEATDKADRGTEIVLHLTPENKEFLDDWRLRSIITRYSDHISLPVMMQKQHTPKEGEEDVIEVPEYETVNKATALWTLSKGAVKDDEYKEFYKHISHDFEDPLAWSHNRVEGKQEYISLLYLPSHAPFDLWNRDHPRGLKLYVQRVFIMDNAEQLLPLYLRFVKGIIDSSDLPLNVSRELLQNNKTIEVIRAATIKRVLGMLEDIATNDKEKYAKFWAALGTVLKEGPGEDFANKEQIAKLLRFATTHTDSPTQDVSFDDYIARMQPGQDKIYYVTADSFAAAKHSPHLEIFRKKGVEVLLLADKVDEWLVAQLSEYAGKPLQSVAKGGLDLGELETEGEKEEKKELETQFSDFTAQVKANLGDKVKEVRITHRLTSSPSCIVADEQDMGSHIQRVLQAAGQHFPTAKPILELNPEHPLVVRHKQEQDKERFAKWSQLLLDQAIVAEGGQLEDPAIFIRNMNELFLG